MFVTFDEFHLQPKSDPFRSIEVVKQPELHARAELTNLTIICFTNSEFTYVNVSFE